MAYTATLFLHSLLLPSLAVAAPVTVKFPNLPAEVSVPAGQKLRIVMPKAQLSRMQPSGAQYAGVSLYRVNLQYQVDGGAVQTIPIAQPHYNGQGGYDGTTGKRSVSIAVPETAQHVQYWLQGTGMIPNAANVGPAVYYSNYGQNFKIDVRH